MESFRIDVDSIDDVGKESTQIDVKRLIKICRSVHFYSHLFILATFAFFILFLFFLLNSPGAN